MDRRSEQALSGQQLGVYINMKGKHAKRQAPAQIFLDEKEDIAKAVDMWIAERQLPGMTFLLSWRS